MVPLLRPLILIVLFALLSVPAAVRADPPKEQVTKCVLRLSPEIDCPSCEDGIKHVLVTAHGVDSAEVDVLNNQVTVRYDSGRINIKALIGRIAVMGYTASEIK